MSKKNLRKKVKSLKNLVRHAWVHSGYRDCGFKQMATKQKKLYCKVIGDDYEEHAKAFFEQSAS